MIIHLDNVDFTSKSGPNSFARRLGEQFVMMGHTVRIWCEDVRIDFESPEDFVTFDMAVGETKK